MTASVGRASHPRILLAHISPESLPSFVQTDAELLRTMGVVRPMFYGSWMDITRLAYEIARVDLVYCWFAWNQAYWATQISRILRRPIIVVAGGFEVVVLPEIEYGGLLNPRSARRVRSSIRMAAEVLAVSESIRQDAISLSGRRDVLLVPLGFDPAKHQFSNNKERLAITVGGVMRSNFQRKGISTFLDVARDLPDVSFALIGAIDASIEKEVRGRLPNNVNLTGRLSDQERDSWMKRAKVYLQLSAHEAFGSAVAEAMLTGCIPVVTNRGALPEVVGDTGYVVPWGDTGSASDATARALGASNASSARCRDRIVKEFPLERRRQALAKTVAKVMSS